MKPLETSQRVLTWLSMCPAGANVSGSEKFAHFLLTTATIIGMTCLITTSGVFFIKFVSTHLEEAIVAMFQAAGALGPWYMFIAVFPLRLQIVAIFQKLSQIYDDNAKNESFQFLIKANNLSEFIWRNYFKLMVYALFSVPMMSAGSVVFCYALRGEFDTKYLYHPFKFSLPWDSDNILGYVFEIGFVIFTAESYILANGSFLLLFMSICLHHRAFYKMFQHSIGQLGISGNSYYDEKLLHQLIHFHNTVKDWFRMTTRLYNTYILVHLVCDMINMAGIIFEMDLQFTKHLDFNICTAIQSALCTFPNIFLYCYFGKLATDSFARMSKATFESNWQNLPVVLQKYVLLIISNTQIPLYYDGFGLLVLNLQTATTLLRAVFTYYMLFKTVTK